MARRPASQTKPPEMPRTLKKAFDAVAISNVEMESGQPVQGEGVVGQRLRDLRQQKDWSIRALAARSGLAINTLSMIENGKTSPSISTLQILARALEVPITAFFEAAQIEKKVVHVRHQQRPVVTVDTTQLEHLGKDLAGHAVQPFVVTLQPGSGSGQNQIVHTGHEFVYCLSGRVRYTIENETYLLEPGDSIVFESYLPHSWHNDEDSLAQVILVLIPADARDTPAERHFPLE
jgi:transcriptional regulator with XRE-family HTH domain